MVGASEKMGKMYETFFNLQIPLTFKAINMKSKWLKILLEIVILTSSTYAVRFNEKQILHDSWRISKKPN